MRHPIQLRVIPFLLKRIWIKKIEGMENIPKDGRFIVTPNHQSFIDDWLVPSIIAPSIGRGMHMYVNRDYFKNRLFRLYLNHAQSIPVEAHKSKDKKEVNERAFRTAIKYLNKKEPMCIYPEGHRSPDGKLQQGRLGAARLAIATKAPILPVGIAGSREVMAKGTSFPKFKKVIKVRIGNPIHLDRHYGEENKKVLKEATTLIMKEIGKLANLEYKY